MKGIARDVTMHPVMLGDGKWKAANPCNHVGDASTVALVALYAGRLLKAQNQYKHLQHVSAP
jgi:hypothetical protein